MKIWVGMSGGVDSSVAALLLQRQGHELEGVFMKNWSPIEGQSLADCPWEQDQADAQAACLQIGIPFRSVNFEREYEERVLSEFHREYAAGRTPNPDVLCNSRIKFSAFLDAALAAGAERIATGHYARAEGNKLFRGSDLRKDQSYFLYGLDHRQLEAAMFPLALLSKDEVRKIAAEAGLPTANKKDSQGICFIGSLEVREYLRHVLKPMAGPTMLVAPHGDAVSRIARAFRVGTHDGSQLYTIGERARGAADAKLYRALTLAGQLPICYVVHTNVVENKIYITDNPADALLDTVTTTVEAWIGTGGGDLPEQTDGLAAAARYQQKTVPVTKVERMGEGRVRCTFAVPLRAVAPGQSLVIFKNDQVLGGGVLC